MQWVCGCLLSLFGFLLEWLIRIQLPAVCYGILFMYIYLYCVWIYIKTLRERGFPEGEVLPPIEHVFKHILPFAVFHGDSYRVTDAANHTPCVSLNRYWLTNHVHIKRPTTGLLMYTMATRFCEEIHLYGFWPFPLDPQGKPVKYHYYDTLKYEYTSSSSPHTMPLEFRTLSALHRQGALRLHTGTCDAERRPQK